MPVEVVSLNSPVGHNLVHEPDKSIPVMTLEQVTQLAHGHVLKTMSGLLRKLGLNADCAGMRIAASALNLPRWREGEWRLVSSVPGAEMRTLRWTF